MYIYMNIYIYTYMYVHIYIIFKYIYIHINVYINTYIQDADQRDIKVCLHVAECCLKEVFGCRSLNESTIQIGTTIGDR
jgi:hypothetical protein